MLTYRRFRLGRLKTLGLLRELESTPGPGVSVFLVPGTSPDYVKDVLGKALPAADVPEDVAGIATGSPTGAGIFWGPSRKLLVQPPFPLTEQFITSGFDTGPLRVLLEHRFMVALVLVRLGAFAVGVWQGESLVTSKTGTGLVHGRHRKGGSSQRRFERRREKQADEFLERVCGHVRQHLEPHAPALDYIAYGGARTTIRSLQQRCPFLRRFEGRTLPPLLDIPRPRRSVLEEAITSLMSSHVAEWREYDSDEIDTRQPEAYHSRSSPAGMATPPPDAGGSRMANRSTEEE